MLSRELIVVLVASNGIRFHGRVNIRCRAQALRVIQKVLTSPESGAKTAAASAGVLTPCMTGAAIRIAHEETLMTAEDLCSM